jgi:hypothetical protein
MTLNAVIPSFPQAHLQRVRDELAPRSAFSKRRESLALTLDALSITRNSINSGAAFKGAEAVAKVAKVYNSLVFIGGFLTFICGGAIVKATADRCKTAYQRKNWEGAVSHVALGTVGATYALAGVGMVVAESGVFASAVQAAAIGTSLFTGASFGLYGAFALYAGYGLALTDRFTRQLNQRLHSASSDHNRLSDAFDWLYDCVAHAQNESELQKKWDQFASYTSESCCRYVREHVTPEFLKKLKEKDPAAMRQAKWMIQEIKRANSKQKAIHCLSIVIAALGIAAVALSIVVASGPFSPLLFAIGALFWLFFDSSKLQEKFTDLLYGKSEILSAHLSPRFIGSPGQAV